MKNIFLKNDESVKKWNAFKKRKSAVISIWLILISCFFSFTAEFWANSKPIFLKHKGEVYFPIFKTYHAEDLNIKDAVTVDFKSLKLVEGDIVIWPIIKWDPYESNKKVDSYPSKPTFDNLMGTDDRGRDVFTRLIYGLRYSIIYAIAVWLLTFSVGIVLGGMQGYIGNTVDLVGQRVTEILSSVPQLLLLIIIISVFQPSMALLIGITSLFGWIPISYYMRGEFLKNRKREYVEAARSLGIPVGNLYKWQAQYREGRLQLGKTRAQPTEAETKRRELEAEVKRLRTENEILKKAAAYFAKEQL